MFLPPVTLPSEWFTLCYPGNNQHHDLVFNSAGLEWPDDTRQPPWAQAHPKSGGSAHPKFVQWSQGWGLPGWITATVNLSLQRRGTNWVWAFPSCPFSHFFCFEGWRELGWSHSCWKMNTMSCFRAWKETGKRYFSWLNRETGGEDTFSTVWKMADGDIA